MEARAETRKNRETVPAVRLEGYAAAANVAAAYERYSAGLYDLVRDLVEDDEKATRITQAAFIAACQALAVGEGQPAPDVSSPPGPGVAAVGPCPLLGYADNPGSRYSRATQLHRCFASGAGVRLSTHEQNELCLTGRFGSCPRFNAAEGVPTAADAPITLAAASEPPTPLRLRPRPFTTARPDVRPEPTLARGAAPPRSEPATVESEPVAPPTPFSSPEDEPARVSIAAPAPAVQDAPASPLASSPSTVRVGGLVGAARRALLGAAAVVVVAAAVCIVLVLHPWDDADGLPSEQDVARIASAAESRAAAAAPAREDVAPARDVVEYPIVLTVPGAQAAPAASVADQPAATSATSSTSGPGAPVAESPVRPQEATVAAAQAADRPSAVTRRTTRAPAGFAGANLRERPSTSARSLVLLNNGTPVDVLPDTATGDGFTWVRARASDGVVGWMVSTAVGG